MDNEPYLRLSGPLLRDGPCGVGRFLVNAQHDRVHVLLKGLEEFREFVRRVVGDDTGRYPAHTVGSGRAFPPWPPGKPISGSCPTSYGVRSFLGERSEAAASAFSFQP